MAGQKFTLSFDANLNVSQMKGALSAIQNELNGLKLPNNVTKGLTDGISTLEKEILNFLALASKDLSNKTNFNALERSALKIDTLFSKLLIQAKDLLNTLDLSKLFPSSVTLNIDKATKALGTYESKVKSANNEVTRLTRSLNSWLTKLNLAQGDIKTSLGNLDVSRLAARLEDIFKRVGKAGGDITNPAEIKEALKLLDDLIAKAEEYNNKVLNGLTTKGKPYADSTKARALAELNALNLLKLAYASEEANLQANTTALTNATKERDKATKKVREYLAQLALGLANLTLVEQLAILELFNALSQLNGIDLSNYALTVDGARLALLDYITLSLGNAAGETQKLDNSVKGQALAFNDLANAILGASLEREAFDNKARDVDALRTRIQYFFGLNNTINLVKRALRGAFTTIKELDKVMTETAVVTNFSVGDMWKLLPEYTKRANELGVTTKAAYEAATLYYQLGLTTKEVTELSVETLKMARIAGLEAAEATDRMTNALRGFNMELNETNALRVDDVYSKLAAISASNVDEISTAMTKVASLAHNAGMEFETTAAFLAQIIETTRESAETAGTALKTVVARFGEVKKLVNEGLLKGNDEEGELINVNKVSEALRTAGIDLNRYFLGEIGIDDIFIELAEKWDSLTSIQQRYIATQAAGSRQQSRFIALMSDYARTQELVGAAYKANGAAAEQFAKTQDSLESKLARLKNAWNEFLMGLTNNVVVKSAVDLLTDLLNVLNKITDVFGEGVGSILKWAAALGTLRGAAKLFLKGGGFTALFSGKFLSSLGTGNIGNILKTVGGKTLFGAGYTGGGLVTGGAGMALGFVGLLKILIPIAAVLGTIIAAYLLWLKLTPEGLLKAAEKNAKKLKEAAADAQEVKKSYEELKDTLDDYNKSYEEASTLSERKSIIQLRNEAIRKAIEEDLKLASALEVTEDELTGELVLTLNSDAVEKAAIHAAEEATKAAVDAYFALADVALKLAAVIANKLLDRTIYTGGLSGDLGVYTIEGDHSDLTESLRLTYLAAAANLVSLAYGTIISSSAAEVSSEIGNALNTTLTLIYRDSLNNPDKEPAIFEISDVEVMLQGLSDGTLSAEALKALSAENFEFAVTDEMIEKDSNSLFEALGINTLSDSFKDLEKILKLDEGLLKDLIKIRATLIKLMQEDNRKNLQTRVNKANIRKDISELNPEQVQRIETTAATAEEILDKQSYQMALLQMLEASNDDLIKFQQLIDSINTDEPISAFLKLRETTRDTANPARELAGLILNANQELYNAGNLLQSFLISGEYEEILEDIEKILETDKALGAADIEELAKKSKSLNTLLKEDVVSANALAKALTLVAKGEVGFELLNTSVLKILENMYTFKDLVEDTHNFIKDFDEGIDYGEGVDFLTDKTKDLVELIDNFEYGNERTMNLYEMLFGKDYMEEWDKGDEWIRGRVNQLKTWLENDAYNFFSDEKIAADLGIKDLGNNKLEWNITGKYNDIKQMVQDVAQVAQISEDAAKMLIEAFASHGDSDFVKSLQLLSENSAINSIIDLFLGKDGVRKTYWSESELDAIADSLGISLKELKEKILAKVSDFDTYDVLTGDDLFALFKENLALNGKDFSSFINNFIENRLLDETRLRSALLLFGYSGDMLTDITNTIKLNLIESKEIKDGTEFDLGDITAGIKDVIVNTIDGAVEVAETVIDEVKNAISEKVNSEDVEVEVDKATVVVDDVAVKLKEFSEGGNVDLTLRPTIPTSILNEAGYEAGEGVATVFTHTFSNEAGNIAINFTPIMADSEGNFIGVLSPESLQTYGENVIADVHDDALNLQIGAKFSGDDAIAQAEAAAEQIHELQAEFYVDADTSEAENNIENLSSDVEGLYNLIVTYSGQTFDLYAPTTNVNLLYRAIDNLMTKIRNAQILASQGINLPVTTTTSGTTGSLAKGGQNLKPEIALTGEEAPEIVWNKEKGYAYITGKNGPEFRLLNAGDRVFSGEETKKILKRSTGIKGIVPSYDTGRWGDGDGSGAAGDGAAEEWKNELDRLYNLLLDIAEEQRKQTKLSEEYELLLKNPKSTSQDLIDNIALLLRSYNTEYALQAKRFVERERDIEEYLKEKVDFKDYVWYNKDNEAEGINSVEIDWERINSLELTDKDTYDKVTEIISHLEDIEKDRDEAEDAMLKLEAKIAELQDIWRDTFVDFLKRVLDSIVYEQLEIINRYSELSSTLSNTASSILLSLQDEISLQRLIRDNTKTEEDINEKEARLAYLRRDTTGKNAQEIMSLEKDISESRLNYSDSLVDLAISRLSDTNDKAAEQREHQIEIMQALLDYDKETGAFNERIESLIQSGIDAEGNLVLGSELETLLQNAEGWDGLTTAQQDKWAGELNTTTKEVAAFLQKANYETVLGETLAKLLNDAGNMVSQIKGAIDNLKGDYNETLSNIEKAIEGVTDAIGKIPLYQTAANYTSGDKSGSGGGSGGIGGGLGSGIKYYIYNADHTEKLKFTEYNSMDDANNALINGKKEAEAHFNTVISLPNVTPNDIEEATKRRNNWLTAKVFTYKTGGLNTKTGPAWLDGTKSKPEYVLNADLTEAFLKLAEVLPQLLRSPTQTAGTKVAGDIYLDLVMNVDEIANDYDVDRIADRVKEIIYDASTYRNVNVINFIK